MPQRLAAARLEVVCNANALLRPSVGGIVAGSSHALGLDEPRPRASSARSLLHSSGEATVQPISCAAGDQRQLVPSSPWLLSRQDANLAGSSSWPSYARIGSLRRLSG
jgi:hypothetical protein